MVAVRAAEVALEVLKRCVPQMAGIAAMTLGRLFTQLSVEPDIFHFNERGRIRDQLTILKVGRRSGRLHVRRRRVRACQSAIYSSVGPKRRYGFVLQPIVGERVA